MKSSTDDDSRPRCAWCGTDHMQAIGMVNDHHLDCFRHQQIKQIGDRAGSNQISSQ